MNADTENASVGESAGATENRSPGWRTYEVYQRMRVGETTQLIKPRQLSSDAYLQDPYPLVGILREHYPCYRDWPGNCFWITRYDDVTSVYADDANYETRSRRWAYGDDGWGRDLGTELAIERCFEATTDAYVEEIARALVAELRETETADLATQFCARLPIELLLRALDLPPELIEPFVRAYFTMQRGAGWEPSARVAGVTARESLVELFEPLVASRQALAGTDLVTAVAGLGGGARDLVTTLLERDHETLHGSLANLWFLLLTNPDELSKLRHAPRLLRFAWLETMRHSTPVVSADRYTRHEVERFGRLLPEGALIRCSSAAANRDPRVFSEPDVFRIDRVDLCQREPRGTYRADGLPSGISFGTGKPTIHPAIPEDRPRSRYAITRDAAITASRVLMEELPNLRLAPGAQPTLRSLRLGEMHTCWSLPITHSPSVK